MAYDERTDRRIQRMSVQKVAVEALGPFPVTSKGEEGAAAERWKKVFVDLCDFLEADVEAAGDKVAVVAESATMTANGNGEVPISLDAAMQLADHITKVSEGNETLKGAVKLQFVKFGVKPGPLLDCVSKLNKTQADELVELINKEV